jgi:NDP-sugar pyrophosphorylase family protein
MWSQPRVARFGDVTNKNLSDVVCCILAGGRGTRLGQATDDLPKPLVEVAGRPFLVHQLELLARRGVRRIVLSVGYRGDQIEAFIGDGSSFGVTVAYAYDPVEGVGTAGALRAAADLLGRDFLVLYGDTYLEIDYLAVAARQRTLGVPALLSVWHNRNELERSNACFDGRLVTAYDKRQPPLAAEWIDYGLLAMTPGALTASVSDDLADVVSVLAARGLLGGYEAEQRFWDIGTPSALNAAASFLGRHRSAPPGPAAASSGAALPPKE